MFSLIYITAGDLPEARKIGHILVEERLAACANIFPITSIFRWEGNVDEVSEYGIIVKTRTEKVKEIEKRVKEIHSYEVPCVISFKIDDGSPEYLKWIKDSVSCQADSKPIRIIRAL
jgi:periplasmic divalent cation tolerance protein